MRRVCAAVQERRARQTAAISSLTAGGPRRGWSDYDAEADVNVRSSASGMTALHFLIQGGSILLIQCKDNLCLRSFNVKYRMAKAN